MRILLTGAAGMMGTVIAAGLGERYILRGFDIAEDAEVEGLSEYVAGDVADLATVRRAMPDVDVVLHLAGIYGGHEDQWRNVLSCNIVGTRNVFEAAREHGVRRVVFASRAGLLASYPEHITRTVDMPTRPDELYSVSKVFGEALAYMYHAAHGMEVVCVRIGNFLTERPEPSHPHHLGHADTVRLFERAAIHPGIGFEIVFGASGTGGDTPLYDLEHGRRAIGYEPAQNIEPTAPRAARPSRT